MITVAWEGETEIQWNPKTGELVYVTPLGTFPVPAGSRAYYIPND